MRKKCVRWSKTVRVPLIAVIAVGAALVANTGAQSIDPTRLPLLSAASFEYLGAFRMPKEMSAGDSFSYGGKVMAYSPTTSSLFVSSRAGKLAEVSIPNPSISDDVAQLPVASYLQPFSDPMEGRLADVASTGAAIAGLMVYNDRLYGTASIYYDASNTQKLSHFSRSTQLNLPSFSGWSRVWDASKTGFVSGYLAPVPVEWRSRLGGPAATGQCCIPIVTRTSWGPAALTFDPAQIGTATVPASPLLYYTGEHATLGQWSGSNPTYGATIQVGGMAIIGGTRTAVFVGRNGVGPYCYGNGTSDPAKHGTASPDGSHWCYDPTTSDKGQHAYPYRYQLWAYDLNDLAAVKAGLKQPWEVAPYGVWPFDLPTYEKGFKIGGVTYDALRQQLYVAQLSADKAGVASHPVIHVFQLNVAPAPVPVSSVSLSSTHSSPQLPSVPVTFTAAPTDGEAPYQYKWAVSADGTTWTPAGPWTASNSFAWTPSAPGAGYRVSVVARSAWNDADEGEAAATLPFVIAEPPPPPPPPPPAPAPTPSSKVTAVALAANAVSPQNTGTPITWTATATGGANVRYKWLVHNGTAWVIYKHWSSDASFTYVPGVTGGFKVSVWAKSGSNQNDAAEASIATPTFQASGVTVVTVPPPPQSSSKVLGVYLAPSIAAPQVEGSTVTWSATAVGGSAPPLYKWFVHDGYAWVAQGGWTSSSTFTWRPAVANSKYRVSVWAKSGTNTADAAEASMAFEFLIVTR